MEYTLILLKPDAVARGLKDEIFADIEAAGLEIIATEEDTFNHAIFGTHYTMPENWFGNVGGRMLEGMQRMGIDPVVAYGTADREALGHAMRGKLIEFMQSGPIVAALVGGDNAVKAMRALAGATDPSQAAPDTIRGKYGSDDSDTALREGRALHNVIHSSGNAEEALAELKLWFPAYEHLYNPGADRRGAPAFNA